MAKRAGRLEKKSIENCPDTVREKLQSDVERYCKSQQMRCEDLDSCVTLEEKMNLFMQCINARITINMTCFEGGNEGHVKAVADAINGLIRCQGYYFSKCIEPMKEPEPVPEPDSDFMKKMEELTGLAGTALIIYLIISELSRIFIPRNFVPVP